MPLQQDAGNFVWLVLQLCGLKFLSVAKPILSKVDDKIGDRVQGNKTYVKPQQGLVIYYPQCAIVMHGHLSVPTTVFLPGNKGQVLFILETARVSIAVLHAERDPVNVCWTELRLLSGEKLI